MKTDATSSNRGNAVLFWLVALFLWPVFAHLYALLLALPLALVSRWIPEGAAEALSVGTAVASYGLGAATMWMLWRRMPRIEEKPDGDDAGTGFGE